MSDDWAKRDREAAARAVKDMEAVRDFPFGTCPASRHVAMMAETLAKGKKYHMLSDEPHHCATSMAQTVKALWDCRAHLAKAVEGLHETMYFIDIDAEDILKEGGMYRIAKTYKELGAPIPADWADALKSVAKRKEGSDG